MFLFEGMIRDEEIIRSAYVNTRERRTHVVDLDKISPRKKMTCHVTHK